MVTQMQTSSVNRPLGKRQFSTILKTRKVLIFFKFVNFHTMQRGNLTKHYLTHTGERPHKCNECGRGFYTREHVKRHKLVHTGEKPFLCIMCGMKFGQLGTVLLLAIMVCSYRVETETETETWADNGRQ